MTLPHYVAPAVDAAAEGRPWLQLSVTGFIVLVVIPMLVLSVILWWPRKPKGRYTAPKAPEELRPSSPNSAVGIVESVFIDFEDDELLTHMLTYVKIRVYEDSSVTAALSTEQAKELLDHLRAWEQRRHKAGRAN